MVCVPLLFANRSCDDEQKEKMWSREIEQPSGCRQVCDMFDVKAIRFPRYNCNKSGFLTELPTEKAVLGMMAQRSNESRESLQAPSGAPIMELHAS